MPFYHGTLRDRLPSILKNGLGGGSYKQLWEGCDPGVYIASEPLSCLWVMLEQYMRFGDDASVPKDHLAKICIIVIDDSRIDLQRLAEDPLIQKDGIFRYLGTIDVTSQPIISVEDVMRYPLLPDEAVENSCSS